MSSTFDGLYIARSGVRTARANLNITGQNITNADTEGYTRQRVDQYAIPPSEYGGFWATTGATCGGGSDATGTVQLRDAFLDGEFRTQNAKSGESSTKISAMYDMEDIFTATTTSSSSSKSSVIDVLSNEFSNFISQLQALTSGKSTASESAIREEAKLLATKLNTASKSLDTIRNQQYNNLQDYGIKAANDLMKDIASLSDRIQKAEISGSSCLELKDQLNLKLDKLSKYVSVRVVNTPKDVGAGKTVDEMHVYLADTDGNTLKNSNGQAFELINGKSYAQFSVSQDKVNEDGTPDTNSFDMTHIRLSGLTDDGKGLSSNSGVLSFPMTSSSASVYRFAPGAGGTISIPAGTYNNITDFQTAVTTAINGSSLNGQVTVKVSDDQSHLEIVRNDGTNLTLTHDSGDNVLNIDRMRNADIKDGSFSGYVKLLNESGEYDTATGQPTTTMRGIGFYSQLLDSIAQKLASTLNAANSTNDAGDNNPLIAGYDGAGAESASTANITAKNIHVDSKWVDGYLTMSKDPAHSGDSTKTSYSNITSMISALTNTTQTISKNVTIFQGSLEKAFASVSTMLGQDVSSAQSTADTNTTLLNNLESSRQEISSVSLDDEAVNLVQFNQSLTAASRFMTAVDECLQTIISNMGMAGRG